MKYLPRLSHPWPRARLPRIPAGVTAVLWAVAETSHLVCDVVGVVMVTSLLLCALFWGTIRPHLITTLFGAAPCQAVWVQALTHVNDAPACQRAPLPTLPSREGRNE